MDTLTIQAIALRYQEQWNIMTTKSGDFAERGARLIPYIDDDLTVRTGRDLSQQEILRPVPTTSPIIQNPEVSGG